MSEMEQPGEIILRKFFHDKLAVCGLVLVVLMVLCAIYAPFIAGKSPIVFYDRGELSFPLFRSLFVRESPEIFIDSLFNGLVFFLPLSVIVFCCRIRKKWKILILLLCVSGFSVLFAAYHPKPDRTDWRSKAENVHGLVIFPLVHYGPFETTGVPYGKSSAEHPMGTDHAGRDVMARMVYGARVSTSVGLLSTLVALTIGTALGVFAGYKGGRTDLFIMRAVEIVICFPQLLLLLILMSIMLDYGSRQSILLLIGVIGLLSWTGLCRLVRGETLKQRSMAYISAAESMGAPTQSILFRHLLPNVSGPIFVTFAFAVAGAILEESSLSFLGFGVQEPTASWGELMRQAFPDPVTYWNLTLWPGLAIFLAVCSFNFIGDGLRKAFEP